MIRFPPLLSKYDEKISNKRYDLPHLRIPVMTFIIPFSLQEFRFLLYKPAYNLTPLQGYDFDIKK